MVSLYNLLCHLSIRTERLFSALDKPDPDLDEADSKYGEADAALCQRKLSNGEKKPLASAAVLCRDQNTFLQVGRKIGLYPAAVAAEMMTVRE